VATLTERPSGPPVAATSWSESTRVWLFQSLFTNLCGITFPDWCRTLRDNHFAVAPRSWHRAAIVTAGSVLNSWYRHREERTFGERLDQVTVRPPLFILGHWRSGTTLLHHLLALDERFAYPNLYEVFFPHTFLCTEDDRTGLVSPLIPRTRVFDNVAQGFEMPNEDEFATAASSLCSPYMMWSFPRATARYERYLTFRGVPEDELNRWKSAFLRFLKKLTLRYDRPLLLKSPPHTARVKILLDLFPDARFVHVHRDPYTVFRSTRHLNDVLTGSLQFQPPDPADRDEAVIRRYRLMHDAYFDERGLIPEGRLHELAFEDLERDPVGQMRGVYESLGLPGFDEVLPRLEEQVDRMADYRKNTYADLSADLKDRLRISWRRSFEAWGYPAD
jgi:omega-hydroxy-beta-dihydromenaquinone-9 sulfotransferase